MKTKRIVIMSVFISLGIILGYIERMIPTPFLVAGAKLGLSNTITVITLVILMKRESFIILMVRILLVSILFSGFSGYLYSFMGGLFSFIGMMLLINVKFKDISIVGISIVGAILHSTGQVLVAVLLFENTAIFSYLPILLLTSVVTGLFVGVTSNILVERLKKTEILD